MHPTLRGILALLAGIVVGSIVNMSIIMLSGSIIPPPEGIDTSTMEGLEKALPLFGPKHFIFPFLAHALGTLVGALVTASIAKKNIKAWTIALGLFFLVGGVTNIIMLPSPLWFSILDLVAAYIPMALL
jgi:hypothetical protein